MHVTKVVLSAAAIGILAVQATVTSTAADARPVSHTAQGCNVFEYTGAHWATTYASRPVVLSEYQLSLAPHGTFSKSEEEDNVNTVSSKVTLSASVKASADDVFASVEASVKGSVAKFGKKSSSKIVKTDLTVHNPSSHQKTYVIFNGVTQYTGTAKYYNCVSHNKSGIGTVQVTHRAPWHTYSTRGGGSVKCRTKDTSKLGRAAEVYC